jgi:hypothetical protein
MSNDNNNIICTLILVSSVHPFRHHAPSPSSPHSHATRPAIQRTPPSTPRRCLSVLQDVLGTTTMAAARVHYNNNNNIIISYKTIRYPHRVYNIIRQIIRFHSERARIPETWVSGLPVDGPSVCCWRRPHHFIIMRIYTYYYYLLLLWCIHEN